MFGWQSCIVSEWYSHLATWLLQLHLVFCSVACLSASRLSFLPVLKSFLPGRETLSCIGPDWTLEPCFLALPDDFLAGGRFSCRARPADKYRLHGCCCKGEPSSCNQCNATFEIENDVKAHIRRKHFFDNTRTSLRKCLRGWAGWALCTSLLFEPQDQLFQQLQCNFWSKKGL